MECNSCNELIVGFCYKSLYCVNYSICTLCERKLRKPELFIRFFNPIIGDWASNEGFRNIEFLGKIMQFHLSHDDRAPIEGISHAVICSGCSKGITSIRYKCIDCPNVDFCGHCQDKYREHKLHLFVRIAHPLYLNSDTERFVNKIVECRKNMATDDDDQTYPLDASPEVSDQHHTFLVCDNCEEPIPGYIFKCIDCPAFYLCSYCERRKLHSEHLVIRYEKPLHEDARTLLKQIVSLRLSPNYDDFDEVDCEEGEACSAEKESNVHEGVYCSRCNYRSICGFRYKCVQCPDYDLCSSCQFFEKHENHFLIRIAQPLTTNMANNKFIERAILLSSNAEGSCSAQSEEFLSDNEPNDTQSGGEREDSAESSDSWSTLIESDDDANDLSDDVYSDHGHTAVENENTEDKSCDKPHEEEEHATVPNCSVCLVRPSNITLLDCGHLCICSGCLDNFLSHFVRCPVCNTEITTTPFRIFY